jgi:hypothetical protein
LLLRVLGGRDLLSRRSRLLSSRSLVWVFHLVLETAQSLTNGGACVGELARADDYQDDDQKDNQVGWSDSPRHCCFSLRPSFGGPR